MSDGEKPAAEWIDAETKIADAPGDHHDKLRLWLRLLSSSRVVETEVRRRLGQDFDFTLPRFDLLSQLYRVENGLVLGEISKRLMVSAGNITAIVDRLVLDGYITRTPDANDRRVQIIHMTPAGRSFFAEMAAAHESWIDELFSELDAGEIQALLTLLNTLKSSARHNLEKGPQAKG